MKTFCIYTPSVKQTLDTALECVSSFKQFNGWEPELFAGCDPTTFEEYESKYRISNQRSEFSTAHQKHVAKKSCFYSHYALWEHCVKIREPICIVEYDVICIRDYPNDLTFDGVMHFAIESILRLGVYQKKWPNDYQQLIEAGNGIFSSNFSQRRGGYPCIPGNVAYGITPSASLILLKDCALRGWLQNDVLMTSALFPLHHIMPPLIEYDKRRELHTSHVKDKQKE